MSNEFEQRKQKIADSFFLRPPTAEDLRNEMFDMENNTSWITLKTNELMTVPLFKDALSAEDNIKDYSLYDAAANGPGIAISDGSISPIPLRDIAVKDLLTTAKVSGSAFKKLLKNDKNAFSNVMNMIFKSSGYKNSKALLRNGKITGILSANGGGFDEMPMTYLFDISEKTLKDKFGEIEFIDSFISNEFVESTWALTESRDDLLQIYANAVGSSQKHKGLNFMPVARFSTSDTGNSAACLMPMFRTNEGINIHIGKGIKVKHVRHGAMSAMDVFADECQSIYAQYNNLTETIGKMAKTTINNPANTYIGICNKLGISPLYASIPLAELEIITAGRSCNMHDIYLYMLDTLLYAKEAKRCSEKTLLTLEETIAKILYLNWKAFDIGGTVAWKNVNIS